MPFKACRSHKMQFQKQFPPFFFVPQMSSE